MKTVNPAFTALLMLGMTFLLILGVVVAVLTR
jgi:hypothetical protein